MKVYNEAFDRQPADELLTSLELYREARNFNPSEYVDQKSDALNEYMRGYGLKGCVLGVSGGIDSALALGLIVAAAKKEDSPITDIVPMLMPIEDETATANQDNALAKGRELCAAFELEPRVVNLTAVHALTKAAIDSALSIDGSDWAAGQLVPNIRTPAVYYATSLLTQTGRPAIVCGTTNRDEGGYLGFFGKASDATVDVQLISDLHKSEVNAASRYLGVPQSILEAAPSGDMYDARPDEEVFGTTYDFVELYIHYLNLEPTEQQAMKAGWSPGAADQFEVLAGRLEKLHGYNAHKYKIHSPAVHLDVLEAGVKGGWNNG